MKAFAVVLNFVVFLIGTALFVSIHFSDEGGVDGWLWFIVLMLIACPSANLRLVFADSFKAEQKKGTVEERRIINNKQKVVLLVGIAVIALIGLFPPNPLGGAKIWVAWPWWKKLTTIIMVESLVEVPLFRIHHVKLLVEWSVVMLITAGLILAFKDKKAKEEPKQ